MPINEIQEKSFLDFFRERMAEKRLLPAQIAKATAVPDGHLEALARGEFEKLPALPYVRGYIQNIAQYLEVDPEAFWEMYRKEAVLKTSGPTDELPRNRYAISKVDLRRSVIGAVMIVLAAIYFFINGDRLIGRPALSVTDPGASTMIVETPTVILRGAIDPKDTLRINGEVFPTDRVGRFEKEYSLEIGPNTIVIEARRFLGRSVTAEYQIFYEARNGDDGVSTEGEFTPHQ